MTQSITMPQAIGIVTLDIKDEKTLKTIRTQTIRNAITFASVWDTIMGIDLDSRATASETNFATWEFIYVDTRILTPGLTTLLDGIQSSLIQESSKVQPWTYFESVPDFGEVVSRFNSPVTVRTINSIHLRSTGNYFGTNTALSTPCIQNPGEVLDITYRIQFFEQPVQPGSLPVARNFARVQGKKVISNDRSGALFTGSGLWSDVPQNPEVMNGTVAVESTTNINDRVVRKEHFKLEFGYSATVSNSIGKVFRSMGYGNPTTSFMDDSQQNGARSVVWAPIFPSGFANKPIQTIHNHNANAVEWGLDVDFLATSQGSLSVDGSGWTAPDWPEMYRIDHTLSGQVGVSRYAFRSRRHVGFQDNSYAPEQRAFTHLKWQTRPTAPAEVKTIEGGHGLRVIEQTVQYNVDSTISWDDSGITLVNMNSAVVVNFDSTTTPALPVTAVGQVAVDSAGNVWVACRSTGLYRISTPFGVTPVITKMTVATNTLPTDTTCFGVAEGFAGSMWAVVDNGLVQTLNPTAATPVFVTYNAVSGTPFIYVGITDNNWSNVGFLRVDRDSPDNQLAVVELLRSGTSLTQRPVWWSTVGVTTAGTISTSLNTAIFPNIPGIASPSFLQLLNVSYRGGLWGQLTGLTVTVKKLDWGTTTQINIGTGTLQQLSGISFFYDYYGTPHFFAGVSPSIAASIYNAEGKLFSGIDHATTGQGAHSIGFAFETGGPSDKGVGALMYHANSGINPYTVATPHSMQFVSPRTADYLDALNGRYSPYEEIVWSRFNWNGAAWELNYFVDATDTATHVGGPYPAPRENFDTENHTFTGRSMIDVTDAFATGNFAASANATFAFKLIPTAKLTAALTVASKQEQPRVLLDVSDATQRFQIVWEHQTTGSIQIVEDGVATTVAATPVNGATYRLVVSLSGTSVVLYLDGVQIGGTVTLSNAFDWSNALSDLKAFVGCEVYRWNSSNRHTVHRNNFYRGVMENVQLWNVAWTPTDVTNDFGDINGVIVSQPAANLVARYQLTQSLLGLETKLSHVGAEALVEGITIAFANGASPTAFVAGDYHTFGVVDGLLKDNAISLTQEFSMYFKPVDLFFSTFKNGSGTSVIEATTTQITERAIFTELFNPVQDQSGQSIPSNLTNRMQKRPGMITDNAVHTISHTASDGAITAQPITGNGYIEARPASTVEDSIIGLTTAPGNTHPFSLINFGIRLVANGTVDIVEGGVTVSAGVGTYTIDDAFRVTRSGTSITYEKVVLGVPTLLFTSAVASTGTLYGRISMLDRGYSLRDVVISYVRPGHTLTIGDPITFTGAYDPDFLRVETLTPETISIEIGGVPATVTISDTYFDNMIVPGPGEVVINGETGWLVFNPADVGAVITGQVTVIYDKL